MQSDDASRTAPFVFPSEILSEILSAKNFLVSFGFLDDLGIERWMASMMARSSPLRASKNLLRLQLTLGVSDIFGRTDFGARRNMQT